MDTHFDPKIHVPLGPITVPLVLWDIIENTWANRSVDFTRDFPQEPVSGPTIVWRIYRRVPGRDGIETLKPRPRQVFADPNSPGRLIDQWAQWHTIIYQFDLLDVSSAAVDDLLEDFEMLMFYSTSTLKQLGINEWLFDEQLVDTELNVGDIASLRRRTIRYRCILERKYLKQVPTIQQIWIRPLQDSATEIVDEVVKRAKTEIYDVLEHKWVSYIEKVYRKTADNSEDLYLPNIDYTLNLDLTTGISSIVWIKGAKHPKSDEQYYVSYLYNVEYPTQLVS